MAHADVLAEGLYFGEGPRWHDGRLWFSDFFDHAVKTVDVDGRVETVVTLDDRPSGLGWLPDGRLLVVSMQRRQLLRRDADGLAVHADLSGLATFHCNDMVVDDAGRAYVGNFGFDLDLALEQRGIDGVLADHAAAVLARVDPDGSVHAAASDLHFPNGAVITPDGHTMILAETLGMRLTAFSVGDDGSLSDRRVWADLGSRVPDGICLNAEGMVWVANPLQPECFLVAEDPDGGDVVDAVTTSQPCFACMLGGDDGRTLFMLTAATSHHVTAAASRTGRVEVLRVDTPHAGRP
jgi:sugar lactone lactonase YvrE